MNRVWQGVSEYRSLSLRQMVEIIDFVQQNSEAAARWNKEHHSLDQEVRHIQLLVLVLVTCHGAAKQPTASSTPYYSALLIYGRNFVILLLFQQDLYYKTC